AYPTSPFLAFLSAWSYFFGKLASTSLILLVASTFLLQLFPTLALYFSPLLMALCILSCFVTLNVLNLKIHQKVQIAFFVAKSIPPLFVIISAIALYHSISVPVPAVTPIDM